MKVDIKVSTLVDQKGESMRCNTNLIRPICGFGSTSEAIHAKHASQLPTCCTCTVCTKNLTPDADRTCITLG